MESTKKPIELLAENFTLISILQGKKFTDFMPTVKLQLFKISPERDLSCNEAAFTHLTLYFKETIEKYCA